MLEFVTVCGYFESYIPLLYQGILMMFLANGLANFFSMLLGPEE